MLKQEILQSINDIDTCVYYQEYTELMNTLTNYTNKFIMIQEYYQNDIPVFYMEANETNESFLNKIVNKLKELWKKITEFFTGSCKNDDAINKKVKEDKENISKNVKKMKNKLTSNDADDENDPSFKNWIVGVGKDGAKFISNNVGFGAKTAIGGALTLTGFGIGWRVLANGQVAFGKLFGRKREQKNGSDTSNGSGDQHESYDNSDITRQEINEYLQNNNQIDEATKDKISRICQDIIGLGSEVGGLVNIDDAGNVTIISDIEERVSKYEEIVDEYDTLIKNKEKYGTEEFDAACDAINNKLEEFIDKKNSTPSEEIVANPLTYDQFIKEKRKLLDIINRIYAIQTDIEHISTENKVNDKNENEIKNLKDQIENKDKEYTDIITQLNEEISGLNSDLQRAKEQHKFTYDRLNEMTFKNRRNLANSSSTINDLKKEKWELEKRLQDLEKLNTELTEYNTAANNTIDANNEKLDEYEERLNGYKKKIEELNQQLQDLEDAEMRMRDDYENEIKKRDDDKQKAESLVEKEKAELISQKESLKKEKAKLISQKESLEKEINEMRKTKNEQEYSIDTLKKQLENAIKENEELQKELQQLSTLEKEEGTSSTSENAPDEEQQKEQNDEIQHETHNKAESFLQTIGNQISIDTQKFDYISANLNDFLTIEDFPAVRSYSGKEDEESENKTPYNLAATYAENEGRQKNTPELPPPPKYDPTKNTMSPMNEEEVAELFKSTNKKQTSTSENTAKEEQKEEQKDDYIIPPKSHSKELDNILKSTPDAGTAAQTTNEDLKKILKQTTSGEKNKHDSTIQSYRNQKKPNIKDTFKNAKKTVGRIFRK